MTNLWRSWHARALEAVDGLGLLALRLWLAQEFVQAGWMKVAAGPNAPEWFAGLSFPLPLALLGPDWNWRLAGWGELVLGGLLAVGLATRFSALGLGVVTLVAVNTVHFALGWSGWNQIETEAGQGFKLPLMMGVMLLALATQGGGRWSLDTLGARYRSKPSSG
ncbi:DoxX family protein [Inhella gelatinilytica]|uniref:DoxX family protein n=1 Tax=Inhella gelatinilytica TaxID=2795030 RepID=A0A931NDV9_9BURK|nr:DoxX family protein [Inhella gelatinilytica]MBH9553039.1 DoxX family protein [Inhella gelatinilytica]